MSKAISEVPLKTPKNLGRVRFRKLLPWETYLSLPLRTSVTHLDRACTHLCTESGCKVLPWQSKLPDSRAKTRA